MAAMLWAAAAVTDGSTAELVEPSGMMPRSTDWVLWNGTGCSYRLVARYVTCTYITVVH